ncbi:RNA polymerase sigma factor [Spirillospora sp. NPDC050679]
MAEPAPSDAEIIAASQQAPVRFSEIFDRHYSEIQRYIDRRLGSSDADDIAAETFLIAFRSRARFDGTYASARPWLYGIATKLVSRHRRDEERRYRALTRLHTDGATEQGHEESVTSAVAAENAGLSTALAKLSRGDRDVLLLVTLAELSYPEVAVALGIKYGTVCSRLHRAKRQIRAVLADTYTNPLEGGGRG